MYVRQPVIRPAIDKISTEFRELPGLRLTVRQAARLCALEPNFCRAVLDGLVDAKFLRVQRDGSYARALR
jgi:hypothetical protein